MIIDDFFPSKYLKSADLKGKDVALTIRDVERKQFEEETKPIVWFEGTTKGLILNRTNFGSIAQLHGRDTDTWIGKRVALFGTEVDFRGTQTLAIRVRLTAPAETAPKPEPATITDNDIPF